MHVSLSLSSSQALWRALKPSVPNAIPIKQALKASAPLHGLLQRVRLSESRLQRLLPIIPKGLHRQIKAGPADEDNWTVLAASPAVAAKVRQILPTLTAAVAQQEQRNVLIRVKVTH